MFVSLVFTKFVSSCFWSSNTQHTHSNSFQTIKTTSNHASWLHKENQFFAHLAYSLKQVNSRQTNFYFFCEYFLFGLSCNLYVSFLLFLIVEYFLSPDRVNYFLSENTSASLVCTRENLPRDLLCTRACNPASARIRVDRYANFRPPFPVHISILVKNSPSRFHGIILSTLEPFPCIPCIFSPTHVSAHAFTYMWLNQLSSWFPRVSNTLLEPPSCSPSWYFL